MSDTLQEQDDQMTIGEINKRWCDECKGVIHAPWCSLYASADRCPQCGGFNTSRGKTRLWCNDCQRHTWTYGSYEFTKEVPDQTATSEHQPAARGGGDEWYTDSRRSTDATIYTRIGNQWVGQVHARFADQIVTEHNQHQALAGERERLLEAIREVAIPSLRYCKQKYDHDDQARLNLEALVESVEQRSTSE